MVNSIGFAGHNQRFVVAIMNSLRGQGNQNDGRATVTHVARDLLS
nr:hypothetical protein [Gordonia bronchialis]